jgi:uncharacterized membrane protein YdbT with pleckstrin-like domain
MKKNQKIVLMIVGILITTGIWNSALALTKEEKQAEIQTKITEKKEAMETKRTETQARIEEKKEMMQEKREERQERRQERFQRISSQINTKIENLIARLEEAGITTDTIKTYLTEFKAKNALVEEAAFTLDNLSSSEDKTAIKTAQEELKNAIKNMRDYYQKTLRPAIKKAILEARPDLTE